MLVDVMLRALFCVMVACFGCAEEKNIETVNNVNEQYSEFVSEEAIRENIWILESQGLDQMYLIENGELILDDALNQIISAMPYCTEEEMLEYVCEYVNLYDILVRTIDGFAIEAC